MTRALTWRTRLDKSIGSRDLALKLGFWRFGNTEKGVSTPLELAAHGVIKKTMSS